ncbi:MAG: hypothetical protein WBB07_11905 [Mycobacterium sp.]
MPEADSNTVPGDPATHHPAGDDTAHDDRPITGYGIGSAVLGALCVGAAVLLVLIWTGHRGDSAELSHRAEAMRAAADWTSVLINMNAGNVEPSLQTLHEGTVGQLNADFDAAVAPYREVVQTLQSSTTGSIQAVAVETTHTDLDREPGTAPPPQPPALAPGMSSRTDTVLVVATSVSENVGGEPQTVRWNMRLDVTEVDGRLLISRLESMR